MQELYVARRQFLNKFRQEREIAPKSREEGEIGWISRQEGDLLSCTSLKFWMFRTTGLGTIRVHTQENNVYGIYQLFLNYFNVTISNLATTS